MNPTSYNGQTFNSQSEAARKLGVHHNTIWRHLSVHGNLDRLHDDRDTTNKPVVIGHQSWGSRSALAHALGVHRSTIVRWLKPTASKHQKERLHQMIAALEERK